MLLVSKLDSSQGYQMEKDFFPLTRFPFPLQLFPLTAFLQTASLRPLSSCSGDPPLFRFLKATAPCTLLQRQLMVHSEVTSSPRNHPKRQKTRKQLNSFDLQQADRLPSSQLVPVEMHQGLRYPLVFAQRERKGQYTPIHQLSSDKPCAGPTAIHYTLRHCSTDCTDPPKGIYKVRLPALRKHENSRANR